MRPRLPTLVVMLLLFGIVLGGLLVFAADPLLYTVEKDPARSVFHVNPALLYAGSVSSATDLVPLMQEMIDGQEPIIGDIQFRDPTAVQNGLAVYADRWYSLEEIVLDLNLNEGEIGTFIAMIDAQEGTLSELMNQTAAFDSVQRVAAQNRDNQQVQAMAARQGTSLKKSIRELADRYEDNHGTVLGISTSLALDTTKYREALDGVKGLADEIEGKEVPEPTAVQEDYGISFYTDPREVAYREPVQIFGEVYPPGTERVVAIFLDDTRIATTRSDLQGNYRTDYIIGRVWTGMHTLKARTGGFTSTERDLYVQETGSVTGLSAAAVLVNRSVTGVFCNGSVMANHPVQNAPVRIFIDGSDSGEFITARDGTFSGFLPLPPGSHTIRAVFSPGDLPLSASASDEVQVTVWAPFLSLPDLSSMDRILQVMAVLLIGAVLIILAADEGGVLPRPKRKENMDADQIQANIEEMLRVADRKSGSDADFQAAISSLLDQYWTALTKDGLSEAARQAYLTLAGRIAQNLGLPLGYRTLTPREMSEYCSGERYAGLFTHFVSNYEKIRYGSSNNEKDRDGFERALQTVYQEFRGDQY